jgi:hypothetical protein
MSKSMNGGIPIGNKNLPNESLDMNALSSLTAIANYFNQLPIGANLTITNGEIITPGVSNIRYDGSTTYGNITYNASGGAININVQGMYYINSVTAAACYLGSTTNYITLNITGTDVIQSINIGEVFVNTFPLGITIPLQAGDTVQLQMHVDPTETNVGIPASTGAPTSWLSVFMVSPY